ncbi:MAG: hypothetical protein LBK97_04015 [Prevotellaceae bacterium]|jgi:DNA repair exonuclease SbcCD ATPase subunit|nr:hypothetical protein [Prevotellaceae bacterium]
MKLCPECEKENPSSANCCMYCGAVLSEENLDETARLQRELNEANKTIDLLKQSLAKVEEHAEHKYSEASKALQASHARQLFAEKQKCEKIIAKKDQQCSALKTQQKKTKGLLILFALLCVITGAVAAVFYSGFNELKKNKQVEADNKQLTDTVNKNQEELGKLMAELEKENNRLKSENKQLANKANENPSKLDKQADPVNPANELKETSTIKITRIELSNYNKDGSIIDDFGSVLHSSKVRYLLPKIHFTNQLKKGKTFNFTINYYDSQGKLKSGASANEKCTSENYISTAAKDAILSMCGNDSDGYWSAGAYTVEIWSEGVCLGSEKFSIK